MDDQRTLTPLEFILTILLSGLLTYVLKGF